MASYTKLTRAEMRSIIERELMDTSNRWWSDTELNGYIEDWQRRVQSEHELVWGSATLTAGGTSTFTLTDFASDIMKPGRLICDARLVIPKTKDELLELEPNWRITSSAEKPIIVYQETLDTITVWPPPSGTSTYILEYPVEVAFGSDGATQQLPAFTKYSVKNYGAFRAFLRRGPNFNAITASSYRDSFYNQLKGYGIIKRKYMPRNFWHMRPGNEYQKRLANPLREFIPNLAFPSDVPVTKFHDEAPSGAINGTNTAYTLTYSPNPPASLELSLDGVELLQGTYYTLSGTNITLIGAPLSGQTLFAHYRYIN